MSTVEHPSSRNVLNAFSACLLALGDVTFGAGVEKVLEDAMEAAKGQYGEKPPRPPHWGGYRVVPHEIEFWQGRADRLHDRLRYRRQGERWEIERLSP